MVRRIILVVVILVFGAGLYFSYNYFKKIKQPTSIAITAIPSSAAIIIEAKHVVNTWKKLNETNIIWEELLGTEYFNDLNTSLLFIDSLRKENHHFNQFLQSQSVFISAHMSGADEFSYLFTISIPSSLSLEEVREFIINNSINSIEDSKHYEDVTITTLKSPISNHNFHFAIHEGILVGSFSILLVEDAIRQMKSENSLLTFMDFKKVMHTSGENTDANVYINYTVFPNIIGTILSPKYAVGVEAISDFANWAEVDLDIQPNNLSLTGYSYSNDSLNNYLNAFKNQKPQKIEVFKILPQNTALILHSGFNDFPQFRKDYRIYLEKNNLLFDHGFIIKELDIKYGFNLKEDFLNWIKYEVAFAITEPSSSDINNNSFALFESETIELATRKLNSIDSLVRKEKGLSPDSIIYNGYVIRQIMEDKLLKTLFGKPYNIITKNYYIVLENYIVFANSVHGIRGIINSYERGKTMENSPHFKEYMGNLNDESNIFLYTNLARSVDIYQLFTNAEITKDIELHKGLFQKFEGFAIQISKDKNGMYYNNIFINYNPIENTETNALWDAVLDTIISQKPTIVKNHRTNEKEVFVQDDGNTIYLISNAGKKLWSKKLTEPIIGKVHQIDIFKNNKLQLLFATSSALHLIDRNGNYVTGYPVELKSKLAAPIAVMDYDKNRKYRILVPTENGNVTNYEAAGKKVKGWTYKNNGFSMTSPFQHIVIAKKDYIISVDNSGKVHAINRKGKERLNLKEKIPTGSQLSIQTGKTLAESFLLATDTSGITQLFLNGKKQTIAIPEIEIDYQFYYYDIDNDKIKDFVFVAGNKIRAFNSKSEEIMNYTAPATIEKGVYLFQFKTGNELGFALPQSDEIYLINQAGDIHEGFPVYGSSPFSISDMNNNGMLEMVVGSKDGSVYVYGLK